MSRISNAPTLIYFHKVVHIALLCVVLIAIASSYFSSSLIVEIYESISPISGIAALFPYISVIVNASNAPPITESYLTLLYLAFSGLFVNLYFAIKPAFSGSLDKSYELSSSGYGYFIEENIYRKLAPSISLDYISRLTTLIANQSPLTREYPANKPELLANYLVNSEVQRGYAVMFVGAFILFPWFAYGDVNSSKMTILSFRYSAVLMSYLQVRLLFEAIVFLVLFFNSKNREVGAG